MTIHRAHPEAGALSYHNRRRKAGQLASIKARTLAAPGKRFMAVKSSPWSTEELLHQALTEQAISQLAYGAARRRELAGECMTSGQTVRVWVSWQLSDWRLTWGKADPMHPSEEQ